MRAGQEVERTFKNYLNYGHVVGLLTMQLILTPMISLLVSSLVLSIILTFLLFIQLFIGWRVWQDGADFQYQQRVMGFF
ncbi:MAG TPA: hypothetical protein VEY51_12535 [Chondromyces sp.]|nr:hypothetical protein [Chondromyces sp.]